MAGTLFVVATPIGNLEDLSPRACRVLGEVGAIACEDTRQTAKLLQRFAISTPKVSYHEHNEESRTPQLVKRLLSGESIALVSDAGTPLLSDPGYRLVRACHQAEIRVVTIPGPFAGAAALSISGLATDRFLFVGFLPNKPGPLKEQLAELAKVPATLVLYLSPHRLKATFRAVAEAFPGRQAFLVREMTKIHETCLRGSVEEVGRALDQRQDPGEYTLVLEGAAHARSQPREIDAASYVRGLISHRGLSRQAAIRQAVLDLGMPRREIYDLLSGKADHEGGS